MLLFSFFSILIRSKVIKHNCKYHYTNFDKFQRGLIDYKISCSEKTTQKIDLKCNTHIKTISIFGKSNVAIKCSSLTNQCNNISLLLFDEPNIQFEQHCNFNTIEIYNSPKITITQYDNLSVDKLILFNSSYKYLFKPKKIIIIPNTTNFKQIEQHKLLMESSSNVFQCQTHLTFTLSDDIHVKCEDSFEFTLNFDDIAYFRFINYNNPVIITKKIDFIFDYALLTNVTQSLFFYGRESIIFSNFLNISLLDQYVENYKLEDSQLLTSVDWPEVMNYRICPWVDGEYQAKYNNLKQYFDEIESSTSWRKICIDGKGYLHYQGDDQLKSRINITNGMLFGIIVAIIAIVVIIVISLYIIASVLYKKKVKNLSINEDDKQDSSKEVDNASNKTENKDESSNLT